MNWGLCDAEIGLLDKTNLIIDLITLFIQIWGILYVSKNLKYVEEQILLSKKVHGDVLTWNKKIATEAELATKHNKGVVKKLNDAFMLRDMGEDEAYTSLALALILEKMKEDPRLSGNLNHFLNKYERLARGIKNEMYDEKIVKQALRRTLIKVYVRYREYIEEIHRGYKKSAWIEFVRLIKKWEIENKCLIRQEMKTALREHYEKIKIFDFYIKTSEEDKWYLFDYTYASDLKKTILEQYKSELDHVKNLPNNWIILGDNHFGAFLIASENENISETYRLNIKSMDVDKTELKIEDLLFS